MVALVSFVLYLPLDWLVVLYLDTYGITAGRGIRDAFVIWIFLCWFLDPNRLTTKQVIDIAGKWIYAGFLGVLLINLAYLLPVISNPLVALIAVRARIIPLIMLPVGIDLATRYGPRFFRTLTRSAMLVLVISATVLLLQMARGDTLAPLFGLDYSLLTVYSSGTGVERFPGPFLGVGLPYFLVFCAPLLLSAVRSEKRVMPLWAFALSLILWMFCLFVNNQRSVIVFAGILLVSVMVLGRIGRKVFAIPLALGVVSAPAFALSGTAFIERFSTFITDPYDVFINQRFVKPFEERILWAIHEAPFGEGLGTYSHNLRFFTEDPLDTDYLESFYATVIVETGLVGLTGWLLLIGVLVGRFYQSARRNPNAEISMLSAAMLALMVWLLMISVTYEPLNLFPIAQLFWLLVGLTIAVTSEMYLSAKSSATADESRQTEDGDSFWTRK